METGEAVTTLAEGRFLRLVRKRHWEWVERTSARSAVVILALTADDEVLFVEQHRIPLAANVIELPAGLVGDDHGQENEPIESAARRELLEETGYHADELTFLAECATSPGLTTETVSFFAGKDARKVHDGGGVGEEHITLHVIPFAQSHPWLAERARQGQPISALVYAALQLLGAQQSKG